MKRMKNLLSLVLALVMVMAMTLTAMATEASDPDESPTAPTASGEWTVVNNETNHKYNAYQIFSGTQSGGTNEGDDVLGDIKWGKGIDGVGFLAALKNASEKEYPDLYVKGENIFSKIVVDETEKEETSAQDVAKVLTNYSTFNNAIARDFAKIASQHLTNEISGTIQPKEEEVKLASGYYLFVDVTEVSVGDTDTYKNLSLLQLTARGTIEIKKKTSYPTVTKEVQDEETDSETGATTDGWGQTADHEINEPFQFKLTATILTDVDLASYEKYQVTFQDTMSAGITFVSVDSVKIYAVDGETKTTVKDSKDGSEWYNVGNVTKVEGTGESTWNVTIADIIPLITTESDKGNLDKTIVVEVIYTAYLNENAKVVAPGAASTDANENTVVLEYSNNPNVGGDGDTGTTPPEHVFVFTYKIPSYKENESNEPLEGAGFKVYKVDGSNVLEDGTINYVLEDGTENKSVIPMTFVYDETNNVYRPAPNTLPEGTEIFSTVKDGKGNATFNIEGLDVGKYVVVETTTPPGYNTCDNIVISVETTDNHHESNAEAATVTYKMVVNGEDTDENKVVNQKGVTLPETGGIGTTIFTVSGIILVIIAGVLLVTKKRMSKEE